jgi:hypothetical protein
MNELSPVNAFVIQFRIGTDFSTGRVSGRIEHVASGHSGQFESAGALLDLLATILNEAQPPAPAPEPHRREMHDVES